MKRARPEPVQVVKQRRDAALNALVDGVPYIKYLGVQFDRRGDDPEIFRICGVGQDVELTMGFINAVFVSGLARFHQTRWGQRRICRDQPAFG